ncbi:MAG: arginine exporter protein ArgO [Roseivirga sp.]|jgi:arginine exporter protein ArgO
MHQNCAHCGLRYELEPSFFFGSMYVSYGYSVALFVATYILMNLFFEPSIKQIIAVLLAVVILLAPLVLRLARITWLNIFVPYDPNKKGARHK